MKPVQWTLWVLEDKSKTRLFKQPSKKDMEVFGTWSSVKDLKTLVVWISAPFMMMKKVMSKLILGGWGEDLWTSVGHCQCHKTARAQKCDSMKLEAVDCCRFHRWVWKRFHSSQTLDQHIIVEQKKTTLDAITKDWVNEAWSRRLLETFDPS